MLRRTYGRSASVRPEPKYSACLCHLNIVNMPALMLFQLNTHHFVPLRSVTAMALGSPTIPFHCRYSDCPRYVFQMCTAVSLTL